MQQDDVLNLYVLSGGGAVFAYQFETLCGLADAGFKPHIIGSVSTGTIGAFMFSKGLIEEARDLCDDVYGADARVITKPGIAAIKDGKLKINWLKALTQLAFNKNKVVSLMSNQPLIDLLTEIDKEHPGFPIEIAYNYVDMITGRLVEQSTANNAHSVAYIKQMVASTSIPVVWPLVEGRLGDAGIREGTPLSAMFNRMIPNDGKKYRIIVISCNSENMTDFDDLGRIDRILARTVGISLNETFVNDLTGTRDRNRVAEAVARHREKLENLSFGLPATMRTKLKELSDELYEELPFVNAPIHYFEYGGTSTTFSFTWDALKEQREHARINLPHYIERIKNGTTI